MTTIKFDLQQAAALAAPSRRSETHARIVVSEACRRAHTCPKTYRTIDWSQCPVVESGPGKVNGAWVLKGTRMPVSAIFENLEAGANIDDITEWFAGLRRNQVEEVIEFAVRSLDKTQVVEAVNAAAPGSYLEVNIPYKKTSRS